MSNNNSSFFGYVVIFFIIFISSAFVIYGTSDSVEFTVQGKERIVERSGESVSSKYLIYTDKGTFQNTDTIFYFKFNSSDLYGQIKEGEKYKADVYGFRFGFLSLYKNITSLEKVDETVEGL